MAEAIVSLVIKRISDLLIQEAAYLSGVRQEVERLKAELKRMHCFLIDANRQQEQDERFRNRVAEIRDLAYDAEDVIDTFILKVANQAGGCQGIIKQFTSIFTKPFHLHKIRVEIKAIQTKLQDISSPLPVFEISSQPEGSSSSFSMLQRLRRTYSHVEEDAVVSLDHISARLKIEDEYSPHVVSICGMGGIGKTTLAKKAYNHHDVKHHFDCVAWVFISQQCKPREVVHTLLVKVLSPSKEERALIDTLKEDELISKLFDVLKEKRYLVVLDDLWSIGDWNILKPAFPQGKNGSKILITTRIKEVALFADSCKSPIELQLLTDDKSWELFCMKAFLRNSTEYHDCLEEFEMLGREMVRKCGGLPLAIVALGGFLATKKSLVQWENVQQNIHAQLNKVQQEDRQYGAVNGILVLSYNDLPYYLKPCFLHLGNYPEDSEISKKEVIRLWIAEGFVSPTIVEREGMLMEDVAEQFLEELINRNLVQVGKRDWTGESVKTCHIHDLLRDLCVKKAREENFLGIMESSIEENSGNFADVTLTASLPRRIAIHSGERYVTLKGECPKLRSLMFFKSENFIKCKNFKFLRVLKLVKRIENGWHVSSEIGNLLHLRYLHLECDEKIILPRSIGKLKSLHTLHILSCGLTMAPEVVFKLECLRHISLGVDDGLVFSRPRFTSKNIETLKCIVVENLDEKNTVSSLKNVRCIKLLFKRSKDVETFLKAVIQFHHLRSLRMGLVWASSESLPNLEPLSQCHRLSNLWLMGMIEEAPYSGHHHHVLNFIPANITKLVLNWSKMKQDPMAVLEKLPRLRILRFVDSYEGTRLSCSANGFLQLHSLKIGFLDELKEWEIEAGAMPRLQSLHLFRLPELEKLPEGLKYLTALQEMKLANMRRSLVERIRVIKGREGDDFSNVSHIPSIQISFTEYFDKNASFRVQRLQVIEGREGDDFSNVSHIPSIQIL